MKRIHFVRFFLSVFSLIILCYTATIGINSFFRYNGFQQEYKRKMSQLNIYKQKQSALNQKLQQLNDPNTWELLARERLNMIKPDEVLYRFYYQEAI